MKKIKKIKVYIQYPWKFPDSPYYKYLINNAPPRIEYLNTKKQNGVITTRRNFKFSNTLKKIIRKTLDLIYPSLPNAHLSPPGEYNLIHCAHCLSKNKDKPWVADIEYSGQVWAVGHKREKNLNKIVKYFQSPSCKRIITWTETMKKDLITDFPLLKKKIEVVYPPIPLSKIKRKAHKGINLIFVSRYFYSKGGLHALEVIDKMTKKYPNVKGIIVSDIPNKIKVNYSSNQKITFMSLLSQKELFEKVYSVSDIFIYPGYSDSFGFAIPEIMGFGVPVVSVDVSTRKEIIENGKNGFLVKTHKNQPELEELADKIDRESNKLIKGLSLFTEELITNHKKREEMSNNARKILITGKFSVKKVNKQMRKIYEDAIKK